MAKVIVERPRFGSRDRGAAKGYWRALGRINADELPAREAMKRRSRGGTKALNEHLGPLRRYLDSEVGRPWDKVFAEICAHVDRDSAVQDHVRDHVDQYVARHVILIDGVPCCGEGGWNYGRPLHEMRWTPWYVCPSTGLLRRIKPRPRRNRPEPRLNSAPIYVRVDDRLQCHRVDGAWYLVELKPWPSNLALSRARDVFLDVPLSLLSPDTARKRYDALVYATAFRRLARRELSQFPIPEALW
jgi:hypothetical protein